MAFFRPTRRGTEAAHVMLKLNARVNPRLEPRGVELTQAVSRRNWRQVYIPSTFAAALSSSSQAIHKLAGKTARPFSVWLALFGPKRPALSRIKVSPPIFA